MEILEPAPEQTPEPEEEIKPISQKTLNQIFGRVDLTRDQIIAATTRGKFEPTIIRTPVSNRIRCALCSQPVGKCKPFQQT